MIHWLRFAVVALSTGFALWKARYTPLYFLYFVAHLAGTITTEITYQAFGDESAPYLWVYGSSSALLCLMALWITWDGIPEPERLHKCAIPAVLALTVGRMVAFEYRGTISSGAWLLLTVGAILFFCGQVQSAAAVYSYRDHTIMLILGVSWLMQSMYFFGWLIEAPEFQATGYWAPALLCSTAFLLIGWKIPQTA